MSKIIGVRENKAYLERAIDYFTEKWGIDRRIYSDCISNSIVTDRPLPRWYLMLENEEIIGCSGLITNDFISRQDLYPWLCALFVEEKERGRKLGARLIDHVKAEAAASGYTKIYLSTDLKGYYEKYGWKHKATGYHPWDAESDIYECETGLSSAKRIFLGNPVLETERLILRKLEISDARDCYEYGRNPEVTRYVSWETYSSISDAYDYLNQLNTRIINDEKADWGIQLKETGKVIGGIGFVQFDAENRCAEVGYVLSRDYWGQGIVAEALDRVIRFAFDDLNLMRVEAAHYTENDASGSVMEKAGMQYEGVLRSKVFAKNRFWDVRQYAIIKTDRRSYSPQRYFLF